jgi:hypothetical protein
VAGLGLAAIWRWLFRQVDFLHFNALISLPNEKLTAHILGKVYRSVLLCPTGQIGQIWPSTGPVYAKGSFANHYLTGLQIYGFFYQSIDNCSRWS